MCIKYEARARKQLLWLGLKAGGNSWPGSNHTQKHPMFLFLYFILLCYRDAGRLDKLCLYASSLYAKDNKCISQNYSS